jgi:hypothetical protein
MHQFLNHGSPRIHLVIARLYVRSAQKGRCLHESASEGSACRLVHQGHSSHHQASARSWHGGSDTIPLHQLEAQLAESLPLVLSSLSGGQYTTMSSGKKLMRTRRGAPGYHCPIRSELEQHSHAPYAKTSRRVGESTASERGTSDGRRKSCTDLLGLRLQ